MHEKRLGFVGIVIEDRTKASDVNQVLSRFGDMIRGRIGIPEVSTGKAVIGLIIEAENDRIGAMTGQLGSIPGITVKSAMTNNK